MALGICSVSKKSCSNILKAGPGNAITIVVGGAAESLSARPGTADLTLRRRCVIGFFGHSIYKLCADVLHTAFRLGFIKLSIQYGSDTASFHNHFKSLPLNSSADLVPVFSFGENDVSSGRPTLCIF